jgi:hypothetical protein
LEEMLDMGASVNIYLMHGGWYCLPAWKESTLNVRIKKHKYVDQVLDWVVLKTEQIWAFNKFFKSEIRYIRDASNSRGANNIRTPATGKTLTLAEQQKSHQYQRCKQHQGL